MDEPLYPRYLPAGDSALVVEFGNEIDLEINRKVHELAKALRAVTLPGIGEAVPTYRSLLIHYDPLILNYQEILGLVRERAGALLSTTGVHETRLVEIPTLYGGKYGPDLSHVAETNHLTVEEVIAIHSGRDYPVYMIGFTPGFPYLGGMDERIATPRLQTPRTLVPAGSVGIAGKQTGVYSIDSPGGWQLIGYTPLKLFDPEREPPSLLAPGDVVRFVPVPVEAVDHDA